MSCNPSPGYVPSGYQGEDVTTSDVDMPPRDDLSTDESELSNEPPLNLDTPQTPLSKPPIFFPHPDERIHSCGLHVVNPIFAQIVQSFVFFVDTKTFLSPNSSPMFTPSSEGKEVPWEAWGPQSTRWFWGSSTDWGQHTLWGYRTVEIFGDDRLSFNAVVGAEGNANLNEASTGLRRVKVRVRDFNPYAVKKAFQEQEDEDRWEDEHYGRSRCVFCFFLFPPLN
jgi:hypothetical protein